MLRLTKWIPFILVAVMGKCLMMSSEGQDISTRIAKALAKWRRVEVEKIALLPLSPVPHPPAPGKIIRGESPFICMGPVMAVLRGQRVYVVDDKEKELIECSIDGRLLRQLKFPPNAPKSLSGALSLCDNLLWVSFETTPYAFAVDLSRWKVIEERSWEAGKRRDHLRVAVVKALFATSDKTLYVVMPGEYTDGGVALWKLVKVNPQGDQQEQMLEGWYPCYVTSNGEVYWISHNTTKFLSLGCAKFGGSIKLIAEISAESLGANSIHHRFESTLMGIHDGKIICEITANIPVSPRSEFVSTGLFVEILMNGQVKVIGLHPPIPMSARYWCFPRYSMYDGQVYFIAREDVEKISHFWLARLKIQF